MFIRNLAMIGFYLIGLGTAIGQPASSAATPADNGEGSVQGNPLKFGSVIFHPTVALRHGYDDNITLAPRNTVSSTVQALRVGLLADYKQQGDRYQLGYDGTYNRYLSSPIDDIYNQQIDLQGNNFLNSRHALRWMAIYRDAYDPRGSTDRDRVGGTVVSNRAPDHYAQRRIGGTYSYGVEGSQGRLEFDAFQNSKQYQNNRDSTRTADVDSRELGFRFLYRVMPKTQLVFDVRDTNFDYRAADARLDSTERKYLIGANWSATAATSGSVRVGQTVREYRDFRSGFSGFSWEAAINWKPFTYSRFDFNTSRSVVDPVSSQTYTNYVLATVYGVKWTHDWTSYVHTSFAWNHLASDYDETTSTPRRDKVNNYLAGVYYDFRRWISLGLEYSESRRDSNDSNFVYDRQRTMALIEAKF